MTSAERLSLAAGFPGGDQGPVARTGRQASCAGRASKSTRTPSRPRSRAPTYDGFAIQPLYTAAGHRAGVRLPGPPAVRARRHARRPGARRLGRPPAPRRPGPRRRRAARCSPTWRTAAPRCGSSSARPGCRPTRSPACSTRSTSTSRRSPSTPAADVGGRGRRAAGRARRQGDRGQRGARQPRRRPARAAGPHRRGRRPRRRRRAGRAVAQDYPKLRVDRRGRPALPRGRRVRRPGARLRDRHRRGLPARCSPAPGSTSSRPPRQLEFRFAATADQFATIAKLRAARRLWARVTRGVRRERAHRPAARRDLRRR